MISGSQARTKAITDATFATQAAGPPKNVAAASPHSKKASRNDFARNSVKSKTKNGDGPLAFARSSLPSRTEQRTVSPQPITGIFSKTFSRTPLIHLRRTCCVRHIRVRRVTTAVTVIVGTEFVERPTGSP